MNINEIKEKLLVSVDMWADVRIDDMVKASPMLAIPSVYMKRAAHNIIAKNKEKWNGQMDNIALFIADENGEIDTDTIFADMMQMMKSASDLHFDLGIVHGHINNGTVSIDLPDNMATAILFGSKRSINLSEDDFKELKDLLTQ